mmetsp:Transcript_15008/g.32746  ORF Transcript_15008/g.32746 Transcript_15008/m.32746 type:complete len:215 (+) Transcript_15008:198-842(+)
METDHDEIHHGPLPPESPQAVRGDPNAQRPAAQPNGPRCEQVLRREDTARERPEAVRADDGGVPREHGKGAYAVHELPGEREAIAGVRRLGRAEHHHVQRLRGPTGVAPSRGRPFLGNGRGCRDREDTGKDPRRGNDRRGSRLPLQHHRDGQRGRAGGQEHGLPLRPGHAEATSVLHRPGQERAEVHDRRRRHDGGAVPAREGPAHEQGRNDGL